MNARTRLIIGLTVVAIGVGVVSLGFIGQEASVRYVSDITQDPAAHTSGTFTLLGYPQPPQVSLTSETGETVTVANPAFQNQTHHVTKWDRDGTTHITTFTLTVQAGEGGTTWSLRNETTIAGRPETTTVSEANWTLQGDHEVFLIQGFADANGQTPFVFGVYDGLLREPMRPTPSQFKGHLATTLPDGTALPPGALVYWVEEYTAGCSSKLLPPDAQEHAYAEGLSPESAASTSP